MDKVKAEYGQTLLDISLQNYGSIETMFELAKDNGLDSITIDVAQGQEFVIDSGKVISADVAAYYTRENFRLNTGSAILTISERVFDESFDETFN
ncbi:MAG: LysM domain-containing protein [Candidatus Kapaibacterium sp.]|nr:MAG: LysM domain-containing protein [Candidatus Kapabacteria bacterium]